MEKPIISLKPKHPHAQKPLVTIESTLEGKKRRFLHYPLIVNQDGEVHQLVWKCEELKKNFLLGLWYKKLRIKRSS